MSGTCFFYLFTSVELGALVGVLVGALVGALVGELVGALVGLVVGLLVGAAVGGRVGGAVPVQTAAAVLAKRVLVAFRNYEQSYLE